MPDYDMILVHYIFPYEKCKGKSHIFNTFVRFPFPFCGGKVRKHKEQQAA